MSSDRNLRRRSGGGSSSSSSSSNHNCKPPHPSSSPRRGRRSPRSSKHRKSPRALFLSMEPADINVLPKCSSEPLLMMNDDYGDVDSRSLDSDVGVLYRPQTCTDIFAYNGVVVPESPNRSLLLAGEGYKKESKVVVTVTVEGSPGPIRTLVKLGCSVEDTIKLVIQKYGEEGRSPRLDQSASSSFDLHLSYFSLEGLEKSETIGDVGSRSFYLRTSKNSDHELETAATSNSSEIVPAQSPTYPLLPPPPIVFFPAFISQKVSKIMRRMHKLWKILGCLH